MRVRSVVTVAALVVAGAVLVAAAVGGTRAAGELELEFQPLLSMPSATLDIVLLAAAVLCIPVLLIGRMRRRRRRDQEGRSRWEWLQRLLSVVVVLAAVLVLRELQDSQDRSQVHGDDGRLGAPAGASDVLGWSGWIGLIAVGLAIAAAGLLWWGARGARSDAPMPGALGGDDDRDAIAAGRAALDDLSGDPRAAVVACYAAMEAALASGGAALRPAESPEELLA
ncbi:MAG: hypothetical protein ACRDZV_15760, partial [Acidimicrobiia bacterium]